MPSCLQAIACSVEMQALPLSVRTRSCPQENDHRHPIGRRPVGHPPRRPLQL